MNKFIELLFALWTVGAVAILVSIAATLLVTP